MTTLTLLPHPQQLDYHVGDHLLTNHRLIALHVDGASFAAKRLQTALQRIGLHWDIVRLPDEAARQHDRQIGVSLTFAAAAATQTHRHVLTIMPDRIEIGGGNQPETYWHAICTLIQIIEQCGRRLPCLTIADWPDFPRRGVMLDISRDKVPTMDTLYALVDRLASWKINEVQLYTEHTFAYRDHRTVWKDASPMTPEQIQALDRFCRERFIDLVPNQNSFGHFHRWLMHDEYKHLAESPTGVDWPFMLTRPRPFSLSPAVPETLTLLDALYADLLPNFSSPFFNVGCDETADLGKGRSQALVEAKGSGRVYLDYLNQIAALVQKHQHTMMFWGDIIVEYPDLVPEIPQGVIALEWGYEATHPFDAHGALFAASGVPFYVCPGTSTWNSLVGRTDNAIENLRNAARNGKKHGAIGFLNTDWGDFGHMQPLPASYLGLAYGAALSWAVEANNGHDLSEALTLFAFEDTSGLMGKLAHDIGNAYRLYTDAPNQNSAVIVRALYSTLDELREKSLFVVDGAFRVNSQQAKAVAAELDRLSAALDDAAPADPLVVPEYKLALALFQHACQRLQLAAGDPSVTKVKLSADLRPLLGTYSERWLARNRVGGLGDSLVRLTRLIAEYETPEA
jgi:hypothetical protein